MGRRKREHIPFSVNQDGTWDDASLPKKPNLPAEPAAEATPPPLHSQQAVAPIQLPPAFPPKPTPSRSGPGSGPGSMLPKGHPPERSDTTISNRGARMTDAHPLAGASFTNAGQADARHSRPGSQPKAKPLPSKGVEGADRDSDQGGLNSQPASAKQHASVRSLQSSIQVPHRSSTQKPNGKARASKAMPLEVNASSGSSHPLDKQLPQQLPAPGPHPAVTRVKKAAGGPSGVNGPQCVGGLGSPRSPHTHPPTQSASKRCASLNQLQHHLPSMPPQAASGDPLLMHL